MSYRSATTPGRLLTEAPLMECTSGCYSQPQVCGAVRLTWSLQEWKWIVVGRHRSERMAIKLQETVIPYKRIFQGEKCSKRILVTGRSRSLACEQKHTRTHILHALRLSFFDGSPLSQQKPSFHREPLYTTCHAVCPCNLQTCSDWHIQTHCEWVGSSGVARSHILKAQTITKQQLYTYSSARPLNAVGFC